MDKMDLLVDLVKDISNKQDKISSDITEMKVDVALNKDGLDKHMEQTKTIKEMHLAHRDEANARFKNVEDKLTIKALLKLTVTTAAGIGSIAGTIYGVIKLVEHLVK